MPEYSKIDNWPESNFVFQANQAWNRTPQNGEALLIGLSSFLAILKVAADDGSEVKFVSTDEFYDNQYWQTIAWIRKKGARRLFKTYISLEKLAKYPNLNTLGIKLPCS